MRLAVAALIVIALILLIDFVPMRGCTGQQQNQPEIENQKEFQTNNSIDQPAPRSGLFCPR
jgi:hypothetical protein